MKFMYATKLFSLALILVSATLAFAQTNGVDTTFNAVPSTPLGASGVTQFVVQNDGKVIVFGPRLVMNGIAKGELLRVNSDGSLDNSFTYCSCANINISSIGIASDGKLILAGSFGSYGKLVRLNTDGSIDGSFNFSSTSNLVNTSLTVETVLSDGRVFAMGRAAFQGFASFTLYRFNVDGSQDAGFAPLGIASGSPVFATIKIEPLTDGRFFLAITSGNFGSSSQLTRRMPDGTVDGTWETPAFVSSGFPSQTSIGDIDLMSDGSLLVAGRWDTVNGANKRHLIRLFSEGNVDMAFASPSVLWGTGVEVQTDGKILFSANTDVASIYRIFRLNSDGTNDPGFTMDPAITNLLGGWSLGSSGQVYLQGATANSTQLKRLTTTGMIDASFAAPLANYGSVTALARQSDGKVLVAGTFSQMNGVVKSAFARVNSDGSLDGTFDSGSGFNTPPHTLLIQSDGKSIAIGDFTSYNGATVPGIVRMNTDGSRDVSFTVTLVGQLRSATIRPDGKIYIVGSISSVNGSSRTGAALINADGSTDNSFNPILGSPSTVYAVALQGDGKVMIGGSFSGVNGFNRTNFARLNTDGSLDQSFTANIGGGVGRIWPQADGKFMIGISLQPTVLDRRNNDGSDDTTFTPDTISTNSSSDLDIRNLITMPDGSYLVSGRFDVVGVSRPNIARLAPNGRVDILFPTAGANGRVNTMIADTAGKVLIGGEFSSVFGASKAGVARLNIAPYRAKTSFDFDGDGRADFTVFRPSTNQWYELFLNTNTYEASTFGLAGDIPVPADFDGDGRTDEAMFRPSTGDWWYQSSINGAHLSRHYGTVGDLPRPGDLDLDGKADFIVFRPSTNQWFRTGTAVGELPAYSFGLAGDQPVIGDFDGDGKVDPAVFRPSTGDWWYAASSAGNQHRAAHWGATGDIPTPADFDGDGKTDIAVYRPSTGVWYIYNSSNLSFTILPFGISEDRPVVADYDGDGKADIALFRPSTGIWYLLRSTAGFTGLQWGVSTDIAAPASFNP